MPVGSRVRSNNVFGLVTDNPLIAAATTLNSNGLANLPSVTFGTQHAVITLDPLRVNGAPEIILVTIHVNLATVATITRGAFGTTARSHPQGTLWTHTPMNEDYISIVTSLTRPTDPYIGEIVYETDTGIYSGWSGTAWASVGGTSAGIVTLAYAETIVPQTIGNTSTETDLTGLSVTFTVPAGRRIKVQVHTTLRTGVAGDKIVGYIKEGSTYLGRWMQSDISQNGAYELGDGAVVLSPTAGSHTYKATVQRYSGTGVFDTDNNSDRAGYILVEDITGSASPYATQSVPVGMLAQAQLTANQATITTETDVIGLSLNVVVPAGRVVKLRVETYLQNNAVNAAAGARLFIKESSTYLQQSDARLTAVSVPEKFVAEAIISPSAGSHTYIVRADNGGGGSVTVVAGAGFPTVFYAEDITPTPTASTNAPNSTLGFANNGGTQSGITTEVDLSGVSVSVTVPSGRRLRVSGQAMVSNTVTGQWDVIRFQQDGVQIQEIGLVNVGTGFAEELSGDIIVSPTSGTHVYKLRAATSGGSMSALGAFILVEDITGSVWPAGSQVTAGLIASESWTPYTPVWTTTGTAPAIGNGSLFGRYMKIGRTVTGVMRLVPGTTTTYGTGTWQLSLPVTPAASISQYVIMGVAKLWGIGPSANVIVRNDNGSNRIQMVYSATWPAGTETTVQQGNPWTWANGDDVDIQFTYEAAS